MSENKNDWSVLEAEMLQLYAKVRELNPMGVSAFASVRVSIFGNGQILNVEYAASYGEGMRVECKAASGMVDDLSKFNPEQMKQERIEKLRAELHALGAPVTVVCGTCGEEKPDNRMADCDECIRQQDAVQPDPRGERMDARRDAAYERRNRE